MSHYLKSQQRKINAAFAAAGKTPTPVLKAAPGSKRGTKTYAKPRTS